VRSDELPLSRAVVDRAAHLRRDSVALTAALAAPGTRVVLVHRGRVPVDEHGLVLATVADATALGGSTDTQVPGVAEGTPDVRSGLDDGSGRWLLLGADDERVYLALRLGHEVDDEAVAAALPRRGTQSDRLVHVPTPGPSGPVAAHGGVIGEGDGDAVVDGRARWASLRDAGARLAAHDAGLVTTAVALDAWHERHPRCPRCGAPTRATQAGWVRTCTVDASEHYPRTDPAVIMAVVDADDRILLAHAVAWPAGRHSTLAGFVEPGESLEHAVRREVAEETGVLVGDVTYAGSQPWPFPASLMVAFVGRALTTDVRVDGVEVEHARWFTREALRDAIVAGEVVPPFASSIARALIEDWYGGPLPTP